MFHESRTVSRVVTRILDLLAFDFIYAASCLRASVIVNFTVNLQVVMLWSLDALGIQYIDIMCQQFLFQDIEM